MPWPSVSVIIPSYNQGRYIERTLLSILKQDYPGELQVIVSDGGSTDETVSILERYPQVQWWSARDGGFVDAVTKGLAAATGEIVAIQSSDDYYLAGALTRAAAALRDDPGLDFVTGNEVRVAEDGGLAYPPALPYITLLSPGALINRTPVFNIPQHCTFARRAAIERVGGLRASVDRCADFDLWYRLLHFGRALVLPDYLAVCQMHSDQRTQNRADLWKSALKSVVEDAENDPRYASQFVPSPQMKRDIFRQWEVLWNIAAGGADGVHDGQELARQTLEQGDDWPDYVRDFMRSYGLAAQVPEPKSSGQVRSGFRLHLSSIRKIAHVLRTHVWPSRSNARIDKDSPKINDAAAAPSVKTDWWSSPTTLTSPGERSASTRRNEMQDALKEKRIVEWNRYVRERIEGPLRPDGFLVPNNLKSILIIVPGSSGDVVLATTVVRYIKDRNPHCRVKFAVKRSNLSLINMCPGVDEVIEWPRESVSNPRSRRRALTKYADAADAVIYPICDPEDMDLLLRHNFLETIWLLSGIPDGMPSEPQSLWMIPPNDPETANRVLKRCLSRDYAAYLAGGVRRKTGDIIGVALRERSIRNAGWKGIPGTSLTMMRHARFVHSLTGSTEPEPIAKKFVLVSSEANMFPPPPKGLFEKIIRYMQSQGRIVLQNVLDPANAIPGTVPLVCSYHEFLCLRGFGIPFVGWRSGLCDIASLSQTPMCTVYPSTFAGCGILIEPNMESPIESFGFASMNVATNSLELVCDAVQDFDPTRMTSILE